MTTRRLTPSDSAAAVSMSRRDLLRLMAGSAVSVVVTQPLAACGIFGGPDADSMVPPGCVLTANLTEGPFFRDERLLRSDIRPDPDSGLVAEGAPLDLVFNVTRVDDSACVPLTGAYLDVWHCNAGGAYSDVPGTEGLQFLRGYQITDADGIARFTTVYPGWYSGRAVHIHFKLRLFAGADATYEFTSQFFFDESLTSAVHGMSPYVARGQRNTVNSTDGIYQSLSSAERTALTLQATPSGTGYAGDITLGVRIG